MICQKYKERASIGIFLAALACFLEYLYKLADQEDLTLFNPFLLRPEYGITLAWYLKFLGINLAQLLNRLAFLFFIPAKAFKYHLAGKVIAFYGFMQIALFFLNFNHYPTELALGLLLLTLVLVVLYCNGLIKWMPRLYYRLFPKELEHHEKPITHP